MKNSEKTFTRRHFLYRTGEAAGLILLGACGKVDPLGSISSPPRPVFYDTYAMALYMDGGLGPKTGIIRVDFLLDPMPMKMEFWHGHGGVNHTFQIGVEDFEQMRQLKKVTLQTDVVEGHSHKLFVDFSDARWRVPGAKPVELP